MTRTKREKTLAGTIAVRTINKGSKSERAGYVIVDDETGKETPIEVEGDNPFEQPTLRGLVDQRCEARGGMYRGTFIATRIQATKT